jgi:hypothetical protein
MNLLVRDIVLMPFSLVILYHISLSSTLILSHPITLFSLTLSFSVVETGTGAAGAV